MFSRSSFLRTGSAAAAATALAGPARRAAAQGLTKIRVGGVPYDVAASVFYAADQGTFAKHGLDVEIVQGLGGGSSVVAAAIGGTVDFGSANTTSICVARDHGIPLLLAAPSGAYTSTSPTGALIVRNDSPYKTAHDVVGKLCGLNNLASIAEVAVRAWLEKSGLSKDAVRFIEVGMPQTAAAMQAGRIDMGLVEEPFLTAALQNGCRVLADAYDAIAPTWVEGGYFVTQEFARANPATLTRFADAIAEIAPWANANHAATAKILEKFAKGPNPPGMHRVYYPPRLRAAEVQPLIDASAKYGILKASFPAREMFASGVGAS